jgi:glycosyltransferase involved in cell wall biosynthesis
MIYLFLYTELADYTMNCFRVHLERHPEDQIHVVHYPINSEAPFLFDLHSGLFLYNKAELADGELHNLADDLLPNVLVCSGWSDREYNEIASGLKIKNTTVVLCFDNLYQANLKQLFLLPFARRIFKKRYSVAWVPGNGQAKFAEKLGFSENHIFKGFYSIDTTKYRGWYQENLGKKHKQFPKVFLCIARYIPQKGLEYLWRAFIEVIEEENSDWQLYCAGAGEMFEFRIEHDKIKHLGFVQPAEFEKLVSECGVFVLPSLFEPWGVAVNEFAAAGFPLLLSNKVGSGEEYLREGVNGYTFEPANVKSIKKALKNIMNKSDAELLKLGEESNRMSDKYNAALWSDTLIQIARLGK